MAECMENINYDRENAKIIADVPEEKEHSVYRRSKFTVYLVPVPERHGVLGVL